MNPSTTLLRARRRVLQVPLKALRAPDALDALLRQIVDGYFVLTDGQGSVSKWSEAAERSSTSRRTRSSPRTSSRR
jgi:hypothetical protein